MVETSDSYQSLDHKHVRKRAAVSLKVPDSGLILKYPCLYFTVSGYFGLFNYPASGTLKMQIALPIHSLN